MRIPFAYRADLQEGCRFRCVVCGDPLYRAAELRGHLALQRTTGFPHGRKGISTTGRLWLASPLTPAPPWAIRDLREIAYQWQDIGRPGATGVYTAQFASTGDCQDWKKLALEIAHDLDQVWEGKGPHRGDETSCLAHLLDFAVRNVKPKKGDDNAHGPQTAEP